MGRQTAEIRNKSAFCVRLTRFFYKLLIFSLLCVYKLTNRVYLLVTFVRVYVSKLWSLSTVSISVL